MNLGGWPLFDVDEGAFSGATTEMLANGNYISTFIYGAPRFDKPILIYWLQGLSVSLLGHNEWAFRLALGTGRKLRGVGRLWVRKTPPQ